MSGEATEKMPQVSSSSTAITDEPGETSAWMENLEFSKG